MTGSRSCPLISVIVPVYNTKKYLAQCVNSILSQTYPNIELILVDDGSKDNSPAMCDDFARKDNRVRVIHQKNGGIGAAYNSGINAAKGAFIGFIDSDDYPENEMYEELYRVVSANGADMGICEFCSVDESGNKIPSSARRMPDEVLSRRQAMERLILPEYTPRYGFPWNKLYSAGIFRNMRFPEGRYHPDTATSHRTFGECRIIAVTSRILYNYRRNPQGITSSVKAGGINSPALSKSLNDMKYACLDREEYLRQIGMNDLAEISSLRFSQYEIMIPLLNKFSYRDCRILIREFAGCSPFSLIVRLIGSGNKLLMLRAVKLAITWGKSMFKPFTK